MIISLIEVTINPEFNKKILIESLSRIGIADKKNRILYPSCYLYEYNEKFYICHFKELFALRQNGYNNLTEQDIGRRNSIIFCLVKWNMIQVDEKLIQPHTEFIFILPHSEKKNWTIKNKFKMRYNTDETISEQ